MQWRARIAGHMAGQLFLRSYERSDRIYNAMLSRGYKGELMTIHPHHFHASDRSIGALSILGLDHHAIRRTALMEIIECESDIVKVSDLHFSYPDGHVALRGISLICVRAIRWRWSARTARGNRP